MTHYSIGSTIYSHRNTNVKSIVGNADADNYIEDFNPTDLGKPAIVPPAHRHRPDLTANLFLSTPKDFWYICLLSTKYDPFEDFETNSRINVPR